MQVGDQIQVTISGGATGLTLGTPPGPTMSIGANQSISVSGQIIADLGSNWQVRLNMSIGGNNIVNVPK